VSNIIIIIITVRVQADFAGDRRRCWTSNDLEAEHGTLTAVTKGTRDPGWARQLGCRI